MRNRARCLLCLVMLVLFAVIACTGLLTWLVFPHGSGSRALTRFLMDIHKWSSLLFIVLLLVHVAWHWDWLKRNL